MDGSQALAGFTWVQAVGLVIRTAVLYLAVLFVVRVMGKRSIKNMAPFDLVVVIMIGEVGALALERETGLIEGLMYGLIPLAVLGLLEIAVGTLNLRSKRFERMTEGVSTVVIRDGRLDLDALRKERLSLPDLRALLHDRDVHDWSKVKEARLEQTGQLTVLLNEAERPATRREVEKLLDERLAALEARLVSLVTANPGGRTGRPSRPSDRSEGNAPGHGAPQGRPH